MGEIQETNLDTHIINALIVQMTIKWSIIFA